MRTLGTLAAILLLLLICTATRSATINGRVIRPRRGSTEPTVSPDIQEQTPELLVAPSSAKINTDLLSLTDSYNVVSKQNNTRTSLDHQVDQSEIMLITDLGNLDEALSIMEYEPQKINRKGKRKISVPHKNADIIEFSSENKESVPTVITNAYYDPPPTTKPKKSPTVPKHYPNPSQEGPTQYSDPRSKPTDAEPAYPVPARSKPRSKVRPSNSQIPEEPKLENPPARLSPSEPKKHKHADQVNSSPKSIRKKKIRKRLREKAANPENSTDYPKPRGSRRPGSFSAVKVTQESNLENVALNPTSGSNNINQSNSNWQPSKDPIRGSSNRKLTKDQKVDPVNSEISHYYDSDKSVFKDEEVAEESEATPSSVETYGNVRDSDVYQNARTPSSYEGSTYQKDTPSVEDYDKPSSHGDLKDSKARTSSGGYGSEGSYQKDTPSVEDYDKPSSHGDLKDSKARTSSGGYGSEGSYQKDTPSFEDYDKPTSSHGDLKGSKARTSSGGYGSEGSYQKDTSSFEDYDKPTSSHGDFKGRTSYGGYGSDESTEDESVTPSLNYPVTPSSSETYTPVTPSNSKPSGIYQNVRPESYEDSEAYGESTATPSPVFHTVKAPTVYSAGPRTYPSSDHYASSALPQRFEDSTWTPGTKVKRLKEAELEANRSSDVVAEATDLGEQEEAKNRRVYEDSGENHRNNQRVYRNGQERYGDAQAEGTHGEEKHEGGKGGGKGEFEEGEGAKHEEGHHETDEEKGEKGYESWHKEEKANKGHHDKEQHSNHYEEDDAKKKEQKEDGEYHEEHQKGEHGEKDAEFDEKGEHKKGHNTKGEHFVHKKDEFEKRTEFFDEFHEDDDSEKDGEFHHEHESSKGGHEKKGHLDKADHEEHYGKKGKHEKGEHYHKEDGHKQAEGKEDHYEHEDMHGQKKGQEEEKKWGYKKGDDGGDGKDHKSDR